MTVVLNQFQKANLKTDKFEDLFVVYNGNEFKLSSFTEVDKDGKKQSIKSTKQFESALKDGRLRSSSGAKVEKNKATNGIVYPPEYFTGFQLPKDSTYVTDRFDHSGAKNSEITPLGLKRALVYEEAAARGERREQYVYVKIAGKKDMEFVPLKAVGYYDGMKFKSGLTLNSLQNAVSKGNQVFLTDEFDNATVDEIYLSSTYVFTELKKDKDGNALAAYIDTATGQIVDIAGEGNDVSFAPRSIRDIVETSYERTGDFGTKAKKTRKLLRKQRSELRKNFVSNITEEFYKDAGSVNARVYKPNLENKGKYVSVSLAEDNKCTVVPISSLRELDSKGQIIDRELSFDDLADFVGKKLAVGGAVTSPLTAEQAYISYDLPATHYQQTSNPKHRAADNSYLEMEDGSFEKETEVIKPIGYKFVKDTETNFDVYIVTVKIGSQKKEYVADKSVFAKSARAVVEIDRQKVEIFRTDAVKAQRCAFANAQAIQTTSNNSLMEECTLLVKDKNIKAAWIDNKNNVVKSVLDRFLENYKSGKYDLNGYVDVKDELIKLAREQGDDCRYVLIDYVSQPDYANRLSDYANLMSVPLTWNGNKLVGGPQYDATKAIKKDFARWGTVLTHSLELAVGYAGILSLFLSTWILGSMGIGLVGVAVGMPIYRAIRNWYVERTKTKYKDKVEIQRKETKKTIFKELKKLMANEKMQEEIDAIDKDKKLSAEEKKEKKEQLKKIYRNKMLTRFSSLEDMALTLSVTQSGAMFQMKDGKGEVNEENANLFSKYKQDMDSLQKDIKRLEKKKSLTKEEQAELNAKKAEFERKKKNVTIRGKDYPADPEYDKVVETLGRAKALCLAKFFGENPTEEELTDEELELLKSVELKVDKKHRSVIEKLKLSRKEKKADKTKDKDKQASSVFGKISEKFKSLKSAKKASAAPTRKTKKSAKAAAKGKTPPVGSLSGDATLVRKKPSEMTNEEIEDIVKKVRDAMEELRTLGNGNYGNLNDEDQETADKLKEVYKENKQVLKYLVEHRDYVKYRNLFYKYNATLNTIKYTYDQYMTQVENANVNRL